MTFDLTPEGWVDLRTPSPHTVERAMARIRRGDASSNFGHRGMPADEHARARGFVAEAGVKHWLRSLGIAYVEHGGVDSLPDIELYGRGVGIRCGKVNGTQHMGHDVAVPRDQIGHGDDRLFCTYEAQSGRYLIVGGCSALRVRAQARLYYAGDRPRCFGKREQKVDVFVLPLRLLELPRRWLYEIKHRAAADRRAMGRRPAFA